MPSSSRGPDSGVRIGGPMKRQLGMALITSLLMSVILLTLGVSFLTYLSADYRFAAQQEHSQQAYYLALAGLEYQKTRTDTLSPQAADVSETHCVPANDSSHYFQITVHPNGQIVSVGVVRAALLTVATRTLVVDPGRPAREYKDTSL